MTMYEKQLAKAFEAGTKNAKDVQDKITNLYNLLILAPGKLPATQSSSNLTTILARPDSNGSVDEPEKLSNIIKVHNQEQIISVHEQFNF